MARPRKQGERKPNGKLKHKKVVIDEGLVAAKYRIRDFNVSLRECTSPLAGDLVGVLLLRGLMSHEQWVGYRNYLRLAPPGVWAAPIFERVQTSIKYDAVPWLSPKYRRLVMWMGPERMRILRALSQDQLVAPLPLVRAALDAAAQCTESVRG
jgi:hypothetical protein